MEPFRSVVPFNPVRDPGRDRRRGGDAQLEVGVTAGGSDEIGETGKALVRRLVGEVMNEGRLDLLDELYEPAMAAQARRWIEPFLGAFSDVEMTIVQLLAEGDTVVGRFSCSGTHTGPWLGYAPTGRRFRNVAEVYFFRVADGVIRGAWGLEDTHKRLRQLGLTEPPTSGSA